MRFAIITLGCAALLVGAGANAADVTSRIIEGEVYYPVSLAGWDVPAVVRQIAKAAHIPAGIERLVDDCLSIRQPAAPGRTRDSVSLTGKRVDDALNELMRADPRYAWIESDGVIVVRPVTAWADRQHFLQRRIGPFAVIGQHFGVAFAEWRDAVWPDHRPRLELGPGRSEEGSRPFTVTIARETSAMSALEQIVRAHGQLVWELNYCEPPGATGFATVVLRTTDETSGIVISVPKP